MPTLTRLQGGRHVTPDPTGGKRALVLCGGGVVGLTYEVGALRALDDILVGVTVNDFDIYVGTSAGSILGAMLANGITPTDIALSLEGSHPHLKPPTPWMLWKPNVREFAARLLKLPRLLQEMAWEAARHPGRLNPLHSVGLLSPLLPSGIFDSRGLIKYLRAAAVAGGYADDFRDLEPELHIVTCALDSGERVVFSRQNHAEVPISLAAAASAAIPILFRPVRIKGADYVDGGMKGIAAIDVAVDRGATLIVVINPIVPIDTRAMAPPSSVREQLGDHLADLGGRGVANQVFRGVAHDGLLDHIRLVRNRHPEVDILLIEPCPDDQKMFFHELMSFSAQLMVLQHGYESVSHGLADSWGYLRRILPKHGIHITRRAIDRKPAEIPMETFNSGQRLRRLLGQTVFDRRPRIQLIDDQEGAPPGARPRRVPANGHPAEAEVALAGKMQPRGERLSRGGRPRGGDRVTEIPIEPNGSHRRRPQASRSRRSGDDDQPAETEPDLTGRGRDREVRRGPGRETRRRDATGR